LAILIDETSSDIAKLIRKDFGDTPEPQNLKRTFDAYGLVTAFLDYCQRPPNLVQRLTPIGESPSRAATRGLARRSSAAL
jgi:hypothetical protein